MTQSYTHQFMLCYDACYGRKTAQEIQLKMLFTILLESVQGIVRNRSKSGKGDRIFICIAAVAEILPLLPCLNSPLNCPLTCFSDTARRYWHMHGVSRNLCHWLSSAQW